MALIATPFGRHSTAAEVVEGIDLSGKRAIVALDPDNADRLWEESLRLLA